MDTALSIIHECDGVVGQLVGVRRGQLLGAFQW